MTNGLFKQVCYGACCGSSRWLATFGTEEAVGVLPPLRPIEAEQRRTHIIREAIVLNVLYKQLLLQ